MIFSQTHTHNVTPNLIYNNHALLVTLILKFINRANQLGLLHFKAYLKCCIALEERYN